MEDKPLQQFLEVESFSFCIGLCEPEPEQWLLNPIYTSEGILTYRKYIIEIGKVKHLANRQKVINSFMHT